MAILAILAEVVARPTTEAIIDSGSGMSEVCGYHGGLLPELGTATTQFMSTASNEFEVNSTTIALRETDSRFPLAS